MKSSYSGGIHWEPCGIDTSWEEQSFNRWVDCVTPYNPAQTKYWDLTRPNSEQRFATSMVSTR